MSDREGHGHKAVLYKSHFAATKALHFSTFTSKRHHCIHRLINHVYTKGQRSIVIYCPATVNISEKSLPNEARSTFLRRKLNETLGESGTFASRIRSRYFEFLCALYQIVFISSLDSCPPYVHNWP